MPAGWAARTTAQAAPSQRPTARGPTWFLAYGAVRLTEDDKARDCAVQVADPSFEGLVIIAHRHIYALVRFHLYSIRVFDLAKFAAFFSAASSIVMFFSYVIFFFLPSASLHFVIWLHRDLATMPPTTGKATPLGTSHVAFNFESIFDYHNDSLFL